MMGKKEEKSVVSSEVYALPSDLSSNMKKKKKKLKKKDNVEAFTKVKDLRNVDQTSAEVTGNGLITSENGELTPGKGKKRKRIVPDNSDEQEEFSEKKKKPSDGFATAIQLLNSRKTPATDITFENKNTKVDKKTKKKKKKKGIQEGDEAEIKKKKKRRGRGRGTGNLNGLDMDDDTFFKTTFGKKFLTHYTTEYSFIKSIMNRLPHTMLNEDKASDTLEDVFLLEDADSGQTEVVSKKEEEFLSRWLPKEKGEKPTRTTDQDELRERLHAKISEIRQAKLDAVNPDKKKKKKKVKKEHETEDSQKKAQFISKANPNTKSKKLSGSGNTPGSNENSSNGILEKTPLRKKSVVKSDGQVVYSKFDFIAEDKHNIKKGKSRPADLLKSVEKHENKISRLESLGKNSEAVSIVENQRWVSAIRRAQGYKVRDDPTLLKRTIRKQENIKKASKKKWTERAEKIQKEREARQQKRKGNIQGRKDEKKKRNLKLQRKRGRIA